MNLEEKILKEVELTLHADDNPEKLKGSPFIYTRIESELCSPKHIPVEMKNYRTALKPLLFIIIVLLNIITCYFCLKDGNAAYKKDELIYNISKDYNIDQ